MESGTTGDPYAAFNVVEAFDYYWSEGDNGTFIDAYGDTWEWENGFRTHNVEYAINWWDDYYGNRHFGSHIEKHYIVKYDGGLSDTRSGAPGDFSSDWTRTFEYICEDGYTEVRQYIASFTPHTAPEGYTYYTYDNVMKVNGFIERTRSNTCVSACGESPADDFTWVRTSWGQWYVLTGLGFWD